MLFLGGVMLDRQVRTQIASQGLESFTENIERLFWSFGDVVWNLEGVLGDRKSVSQGRP